MIISDEQLRQMMPNAGMRLDAHLPYISSALDRAVISTSARIAAFLAQLAHESGEYRYMEEIADGSAYEGRADLGNTQPGDGVKFKGHGPIQITGRANHKACGEALGIDLIEKPRLICTPAFGTASACWFWNSRKLSPLADLGWFTAITRIINGGLNGFEERCAYYARNREILGMPPMDVSSEMDQIAAFQSMHGLTPDGIVGPITHAAVYNAVGGAAS